jgi:microcompartment protein CcmK/EutM
MEGWIIVVSGNKKKKKKKKKNQAIDACFKVSSKKTIR